MITEDHLADLGKLLSSCVDNEGILSQWERDYVNDWVEKLNKYGVNVRISDKQDAIFRRLEDKLKKNG